MTSGSTADDARQQVHHVADVVDLERVAVVAAARDAQSFLEDGCADRVLVDY